MTGKPCQDLGQSCSPEAALLPLLPFLGSWRPLWCPCKPSLLPSILDASGMLPFISTVSQAKAMKGNDREVV